MGRRFGLIMGDGEDIRSLEELREHFDLEKVMEYYYKENGDLLTWLDRLGCEDEAQAIRALDPRAPDFPLKLCQALEVECEIEVDAERVEARMRRLARLKLVTDEPEHHRNIDLVAFNQEELAQLVLDEGERKIFLCQDGGEHFTFTIPSSHRDVTYIGIPCGGVQPRVRVTGADMDWKKERGIDIQSCQIDRKKPPKIDPGEADQNRAAPIQAFWEAVVQKELNQAERAAVTVTAAGPGPQKQEFEVRDGRTLWARTALFVQEVLAEGRMLSGLKLTAGSSTCALGMDAGASAKARVRGVHMERDSGGGQAIYLDLDRSAELRGRKYRAVLLRSASIYEKLNPLEGSVVEIICLGDLPPAVRMAERGNGAALRCPHCGSKFMFRDGMVFCGNPVCIDRLNGRIFRFLEALGLEQFDRGFVQTLMTQCSVRSLKDLFALNREQMRNCSLNSERLQDFPEVLRKAVAAAPDHVLLGKLGVPSLWQKQAKDILERYGRTESDPFEAFLRDLDHEAWSAAIDLAVGKEKSDEIQYWLRCDCRSVKIFRDDLRTLQSVRPPVPKPAAPKPTPPASGTAKYIGANQEESIRRAGQMVRDTAPKPAPPAKLSYSSAQKTTSSCSPKTSASIGRRVAVAGLAWDVQKLVRDKCQSKGYDYVGQDCVRADILVIPDWHYQDIESVRTAKKNGVRVYTLEQFGVEYPSAATSSSAQNTSSSPVKRRTLLPAGCRVTIAPYWEKEGAQQVQSLCKIWGYAYKGIGYEGADVLVILSRGYDYQSQLSAVKNPPVTVLDLDEFILAKPY